jgi:hypothetical protein
MEEEKERILEVIQEVLGSRLDGIEERLTA